MVALAKNLLGIGLYTPAEAAFYARIHTGMMNRWLFGSSAGDPVLRPEIGTKDDKVVTFLDFVQALAIRAIRQEHKIPLQKIRQAVKNAEQKYGVDYPFARQHTTFLFNGELIIALEDGGYADLTGKSVGNRLFTKIAELYMKDLSFKPDGGLATLYRPMVWRSTAIEQNPRMHFGEPLVESCKLSVQSLWDAYKTEGSFDKAAEVCGVRAEEVEAGCRYMDHLMGSLAA